MFWHSQKLKKNKLFFSSFIASILLNHVFPLAVKAQMEWSAEDNCVYIDKNGYEVATVQGVECLVRNFLGTATTFIGIAAFVMLIVGAFLFLTSGGNSKGVEAGKQTFTYAIVGIIVALLAYFILNLIATFTGVGQIMQFNLNLGN